MSKPRRSFRPSPALLVAFIALFVAMGGVGYSAIKLKAGSVKTKTIKNKAVTTAKFADSAVAPDAAKLGGLTANGYQKFCQPGAIKGSVVAAAELTTSTTYVPVTGFNCINGGSGQVMAKKVGNTYNIWFVDNLTAGSAVVSPYSTVTFHASASSASDPAADTALAQNQNVFNVIVSNFDGTVFAPTFTLLAF